jgi:hypothetical protein
MLNTEEERDNVAWFDNDWYREVAANSPACGRCLDRRVHPVNHAGEERQEVRFDTLFHTQ